jgi:O-antigen/teichoic acid export membrane protein
MATQGRNLAFDAAWSLALKLFGATSNIIVLFILVRMLSIADMGYFLVAQSTAILVAMVARFGMKQPIVKLVSTALAEGHEELLSGIFRSVVTLVATGFVVVSLITVFGGGDYIFLSVFSAPIIFDSLLLWLGLVFFLAYQTPLAETYRGLHMAKEAMLYDGPLVNFLMLTLLVVAYIVNGQLSFSMAISLLVLCHGSNLFVGSLKLRAKTKRYPAGGDMFPIQNLLMLGAPVFVINVAAYIITQSGLWVGGAYLEPEDVAVFGAALRLMLVISLPLFVLNLVIQSRIVKMYVSGQRDELEILVRQGTTVATVVSVLGSLVIFVWPELILNILFGSEYGRGGKVLAILTLGQLINVSVGPCLNFILLVGRRVIATYIVVGAGLMTVPLSIAMAILYGIEGIAVAGAIGLGMQNILLWVATKKQCNISTLSYFNPADIAQLVRLLLSRKVRLNEQ